MSLVRTKCFVFLLAVFGGLFVNSGLSQSSPDAVVDVTSVPSDTPPYITLRWSHRQSGYITNYTVARKAKADTSWTVLTNLSATTTSFADYTAALNTPYEYRVARYYTNFSPTDVYGYLYAGVRVPMTEARGTLLMFVDQSMTNSLAPEIDLTFRDLIGDGWQVLRYDVPRMVAQPNNTNANIWATRSNEIASVKSLIVSNYQANPTTVKAVYLLGRVPVPYSGYLAPDGHGDHYGAWPADVYYGDVNGTWTDSSINTTNSSDKRGWNQPGDGKFDQSSLPSDLKLQVGRVDFANMTTFPTASVTETDLLRRYLRRAHDFRWRRGTFTNVPRRGLIDDNFGWFGGEAFAATGWGTGYSWFSSANVASLDWFTTLRTNQYLLAYGCGGGSSTSASGVGSSTDFANISSRGIFCEIFGSYHGDWDYNNNFMRAALCGTPETEGLTIFWGGRPYWFVHHMTLGDHIGYCAMISQNNNSLYDYAYTSSPRGVHMALLGDPALRLHPVIPPINVHAQASTTQIQLDWAASADTNLLGYHVFRASSLTGTFTRLTSSVVATNALTYTDTSVISGQSYTYLVRTLKLETSPGGSYENLSQGVAVTATASTLGAPVAPQGLLVLATNSQPGLTWQDNASNETGFEVQRQAGAATNFLSIATLPPNAIQYTDPGPLLPGATWLYRVRALGTSATSEWSNVESVFAQPAQIQLLNRAFLAEKTSGTATVMLQRLYGSVGAVSVNFGLTNSTATGAVHYTQSTGMVSWADGELASKNVLIPLLSDGQSKLTRSFSITLNTPTNGAYLYTNVAEVAINDATTPQTSPWLVTNWYNTAYFVPGKAGEAEGAWGLSTMGGGMGSGSSGVSDAGTFAYQTVSGYGSIVARVRARQPSITGAQAGVMIRSGLSNAAVFAFSTLNQGTGARFMARETVNGSVTNITITNNTFTVPYWVRLTRMGSNFTSEASANGTNWTTINTRAMAVPPTAQWGFAAAGVATDYRFVLSQFDNLTLNTNVEPLLFTLAISASNTFVRTNAIRQLSVSKTDQYGITWPVTSAVWSVTAGSINTTGRYTAPAFSGPVTVTASVEGLTNTLALTVVPQAMVVMPETNFAAAGNYGGPFSPSSANYTLYNAGGSTLNWNMGVDETYYLNITTGSLASASLTNFTLSLSAAANSLAAGAYTNSINITNLSQSEQLTRLATLNIAPATIGAVTASNGYGRLAPNGCANVYITLKNNGSSTLTGVSATLGANAIPGLSIPVATASWPSIAAGQTTTNTTPFRVCASPTFICGTSKNLQLAYQSSAGAGILPVSIDSGGGYQMTVNTGATYVAGTSNINVTCDDCGAAIALPFPVTFYGNTYTSIWVSANGLIGFGVANTSTYLGCLPSASANGVLAAFCTDLRTDQTGQGIFSSTTGTGSNRVYNLEWRAGTFSGNLAVNFTIRLYEGRPRMEIVYGTNAATSTAGTVGIQESMSSYLAYTCSAGVVSNGLSVAFEMVSCLETSVVEFASANQTMPEPLTNMVLYLTVNRSAGRVGDIQMDYEVGASGSTATPGIQYQPATGTLYWADNDTAPKNIPVTLLAEHYPSGNRTVSVLLKNPGGYVQGGAQTNLNITLLDDDSVSNTPPVINVVNSATTEENTPRTIPFVITDAESPSAMLLVTASVVDTTLITNLTLTGVGSNRFLNMFPGTNCNGGTLLTITVSDGLASRSTNIALTVVHVNQPPVANITAPASNTTVTNANVTITADASDPEGALSRVEFYGDGQRLVVISNAPYTFSWSNLVAGYHQVQACAVDTDNLGSWSTPVFLQVSGNLTNLVSPGALWRYHDQGVDLGTTWVATNYSDDAWPQGPSPLGYGDANGVWPATTNSYGPDPNNKYPSAYYRRVFQVTNAALWRSLLLNIQRDDGAIIYLNGTEIYRNNLPTGTVTYSTLATTTINGSAETNWYATNVSQSLLFEGTNWLAAVVHQSAVNSSDLFFNLQLSGQQLQPPPKVTLGGGTNGFNFSWPDWAAGLSLWSATNLAPPVNWTLLTNGIIVSNGQTILNLPPETRRTRYFRLISQ
ncbi:MAG: Ig-like domain-containing protein [Verrucomicrobiota bacterium]